MERITSPQNPKIKNLKKLEKAGERREQNLILIEGLRETVLAHRAGYEIDSLFVCEEILKTEGEYSLKEILKTDNRQRTTEVKAFSLSYSQTISIYLYSSDVILNLTHHFSSKF